MDATTIIMVLLLVVLVFFMFRNKRKRDAQQATLQSKMVPGVEVMLSFGVYGTLVSIDDEANIAEVEVSPGTVLRVHRQTLGRVVEPVVADDAVVSDADELDARPADDLIVDDSTTADRTSPAYGERVDETRLDSTTDTDKPNKA
ncbi:MULTISPECIES: preprotein translocase subunit YajC [unclassified Frigoribacterium]|jgi:preprotein translocase subunit YajC|uniref:preprotein translocase subunit YajC n=1 Tax=unclassified Frigoribacterium TaxID=2627005 RepID=UPI001780EC4F|nr:MULTISPECIES: preprotein translocase subunit YajC [unclassified Frigoribacterium]MBD8584468.1 preprotein translocase subunit YajC [Frigoribacterium sp. CFBP 8766]MBF4578309.1 preprotein translocase subunit YajC [Frigoribacterium sp. VKM Ac-2530]